MPILSMRPSSLLPLPLRLPAAVVRGRNATLANCVPMFVSLCGLSRAWSLGWRGLTRLVQAAHVPCAQLWHARARPRPCLFPSKYCPWCRCVAC